MYLRTIQFNYSTNPYKILLAVNDPVIKTGVEKLPLSVNFLSQGEWKNKSGI